MPRKNLLEVSTAGWVDPSAGKTLPLLRLLGKLGRGQGVAGDPSHGIFNDGKMGSPLGCLALIKPCSGFGLHAAGGGPWRGVCCNSLEVGGRD